MSFKTTLAAGLMGLALLGGCTETETVQTRPPEIATGTNNSMPKSHLLDKLTEASEKDPKNPKVWFDLGAYWEDSGDYTKAISYFERGNELLDQTHWSKGNYRLGRLYFQTHNFDQAMRHFQIIIAQESPDPKRACLNEDFRESHYLVGAIYYLHSRWREARKEFERFLELGGEQSRVEEFLDKIDRETK